MTTIASFWVRGVADALNANGLDATPLLLQAGLDPQCLAQPDARLDHDGVSRLWDLAVAASGNPDIGLSAASCSHPTGLDVISYVLMSSPDLRHALGRLARFLTLVNGAQAVQLLEEKDGCRLVLESWYAGALPRARVDYTVALLMRLSRWLVGSDIQPLCAEFGYAAPGNHEAHRALLGCPIQFGSGHYSLLFSHDDLALPLPSADPQLSHLHERLAEERLARLRQNSLSLQAQQEIRRQLEKAVPTRESVAEALCIGERTLRRRLQDEGTSFQELLDQARRDMAQHYLARTSLAFGQIAGRLGFADQSAFFRACRRWFDAPPKQFREQFAQGL